MSVYVSNKRVQGVGTMWPELYPYRCVSLLPTLLAFAPALLWILNSPYAAWMAN